MVFACHVRPRMLTLNFGYAPCWASLPLSVWRSRETDFQAGRVFWRSRYDKKVPTNRQDASCWITNSSGQCPGIPADGKCSFYISVENVRRRNLRRTTVVLRLVTTTDPDMADFTNPYTTTQHFPTTPLSQVRHDQRRAAERTRQNPEASEHSPSGLF